MTVRVKIAALRVARCVALCVALLLVPAGAGFGAGSAGAAPSKAGDATDRKQEIDKTLRTLKQQVAEASAEETEVLGRLDATAARRAVLDRRLAAIDKEVATVEAALAEASATLDRLESDLRRSSTKLADTEAGLHQARRDLVDRAVNAYIRNPHLEAATAMLKSSKYRDLAQTGAFLDTTVRTQRETVGRYQQLRLRLESEQVGLTAARAEVTSSRQEVSTHREQLIAARNEQAEIRRQVAAEEAQEKQLLGELRSKVKTFEAQIAALKKESDSIAAFLRALQTGKPPAPGSGVLARPVPGPITSGFGSRTHPILGTVRSHTGVDFGSPSGTPIRAPAAGRVVAVGTRGGYGLTVIIDHGGTLATLFAHQSRTAVKEGQSVSRGQTVGYVGSTGFSTGPHLHFEVRINGNPVDPLRYL